MTGGRAGDAGRYSLAALIALEGAVFAGSALLVAASIKLHACIQARGWC